MKRCVLAFAMIFALMSCKKDQIETSGSASLKINPIILENNAFSKKDVDVNRAGIPVYVSAITVNTTNLNGNREEKFILVDEGGEDAFTIENLPLGNTTISASSESLSQQTHSFTSFETYDSSLAELSMRNPFVLYNSTNNPSVNLEHNNTLNTNVEMDTDNGRIAIIFQNEFTSSSLYNIEIIANNGMEEITEIINSNSSILYYWSDENAISDSKTSLTINWVEKENSSNIIRTESFEQTVIKGVSSRVKVIIYESSISTGSSNLNFNFTEIEDLVYEDIEYGGDVSTNDSLEAIINLDMLSGDDINSRLINNDGSLNSKTTIGEYVWYAEDMTDKEEKLLSETSFSFDIDSDNIRLSIYLATDSTTIYRTVGTNEDFIQLKEDYAYYRVRTDYTRDTWGDTPVNFILRLGDDADLVQKDFKISEFKIE